MEMPKSVTKRLQKVQKKQPTMFAADEQLLSACAVVSVSTAQPSPMSAMFGVAGVLIASAFDKNKTKSRVHEVQLATGTLNGAFNELPKSKSGYTFVLTNQRVVVFDGPVKKYLTECDVATAEIGVVRHPTGQLSVALRDGVEVVAVTAQRQHEAMAEHFIAHYPNQRIGAAPPASASTMDHYVTIPQSDATPNPYAQAAVASTPPPAQPAPAAAHSATPPGAPPSLPTPPAAPAPPSAPSATPAPPPAAAPALAPAPPSAPPAAPVPTLAPPPAAALPVPTLPAAALPTPAIEF